MTDIDVGEWQQVAVEMTASIGRDVLALDNCVPPERIAALDADGVGAYVPVLSGAHSLHVGIVSDDAGCAGLTRALLGIGKHDALCSDDVRDAVGEIANMIAGGVKTKLVERGADAQIGLPIFIRGRIESSATTQCLVSRVMLDTICVKVTVVKSAKYRSNMRAR